MERGSVFLQRTLCILGEKEYSRAGAGSQGEEASGQGLREVEQAGKQASAP